MGGKVDLFWCLWKSNQNRVLGALNLFILQPAALNLKKRYMA